MREQTVSELLGRVQGEIRERLQANRLAVQEYDRLEAALAALDGIGAARPPEETASAQPTQASSATRRSRGSGAPRAPRGANRDAVLRVVADRPGVSASELSAAAGIRRQVVYALLSRLVERGEIAKEELPGGSTGYSLPRQDGALPAPAVTPADPPVDSGEPAPTSSPE